MTYPNGRAISYDCGSSGGMNDVLSRVEAIKENATTYASYTYLGPATVVRIDYPQPQVRLDLWGGVSGSYSGLDRFSRIVDQHWTNSAGATTLDRFAYGYDRNSSRLWRENRHPQASARDELYGYDHLDRLVSMKRGDLNANKDGISGTATKEEDWTLDVLGHWEWITAAAHEIISVSDGK